MGCTVQPGLIGGLLRLGPLRRGRRSSAQGWARERRQGSGGGTAHRTKAGGSTTSLAHSARPEGPSSSELRLQRTGGVPSTSGREDTVPREIPGRRTPRAGAWLPPGSEADSQGLQVPETPALLPSDRPAAPPISQPATADGLSDQSQEGRRALL